MTHGDTLGADLGGTWLLLHCGARTERLPTGPQFSPHDLRQRLQQFLARNGLAPARMGIAVPGLVDGTGRVQTCDVLPAFSGWAPSPGLADLCHTVVALNDIHAALLEEMHDASPGCTAGVVMVGTAIGAAFITNGKLLSGTSGWAGELGYLPMLMDGQVRRLDELAGGAGLAAICGISSAQLTARATAGDPAALKAIATGGHFLGLGLAAAINLLNPSRLAVGGGTIALPGYWQAALATAEQHTIPALWSDCRLYSTRSGAHTVVKGAIRAAECGHPKNLRFSIEGQ